jgi:hypothetical protein
MPTTTTTAIVNAANAYRQIITNFSNPLEFVREAISNSIDASATNLTVIVDQAVGPTGQAEIRIILKDDGNGMDARTLERFFNLGDSEKSELKNDTDDQEHLIGEKGFGTKIYLNSRRVEVRTRDRKSGICLKAVSQGHLERIHDPSDGAAPQYDVTQEEHEIGGTEIRIFGYNYNDGKKLGHDQLKDYILWSTKFGSIEPRLWPLFPKYASAKARLGNLKLHLRGLGYDSLKHAEDSSAKFASLDFGHPFPEECFDGKVLREKAKTKKASPTELYCRRFVREDVLKKFPGFRWQAVFSIEGNRVKYDNPMVRRQGYKAPDGAYKVAERYGIWICKDFIPAERVNVLLPGKGTEFLKFHAFFNCQAIRLSADRTSIGPTPPDVRAAVEEQILDLVREIFEDEGVAALFEALDEADFGERTEEQEKKDYTRRVKQARVAASASHKGVEFREPQRELGVVALLAQMLSISPGLFPFRVLDWNNATGFDLLARDTTDLPFEDASKFYVECKYLVTGSFNHSLNNVRYVVCWDSDLENDGVVTAVGGDTRRMIIKPKTGDKPYTEFFLSREDDPNNIEVFVLRRLIEERLGLTFQKPNVK